MITNYWKKRTAEAILIRQQSPTMNLDRGLHLPSVWNPILDSSQHPFPPLFNFYFNFTLLFIFISKLPTFHSSFFMMFLVYLVFIGSLSLILQLFSWRRPTGWNILIYCMTSMLRELPKKTFLFSIMTIIEHLLWVTLPILSLVNSSGMMCAGQ